MTTRDSRSRASGRPESAAGRDPTQSLSLPPEDAEYESHPSLALGTSDAGRDERTKVESPNARSKTPQLAPPKASRPPPIPKGGIEEPERVGTTLGSYRVVELLGKGGMGYVYRAEHVKLGREVALKLLRSDYARRKDAVARFIQEARTVNRVRHRNIVDVPDILELDDGTTCIVMEFLRGQSLGKWARSGIDLPRALAVLVQICDGLAAAHHVGVVHRDLKPDNIIIVPTSDGAELVKLLDFGVAKLLNRDDEDIGFQTAAGSVIGTPAYMSPEQAGGMVIDARSDIYSLGAIMYELFCGQPMFRGRSFGEYVRKHLTEMPVPPRATEGGRGIDPALEMLILKCLEKDPNQRFASILELRDALLGLLGGMETHPPGLVSLAMSGSQMRPLPAMPLQTMAPGAIAPSAAAVAPTVMPQMVPTMIPVAPMMQQLPTPTAGSHLSAPNIGYYTNAGYSQMMLPPPPPVQVTPWWVWFVGGALAVGLGIAAAVWYASRGDSSRSVDPAAGTTPVVTAPRATPIPTQAPAPQYILLRFDSLPSGGVYAEGQSAELCRTPCETKLDLADGGSKERRTFIVKSAGHKDGRIEVDLTGSEREFHITLDREQTVTEVKAAADEDATTDDRPARTGRPGRTSKSTKSAKKPDKGDGKPTPPVEPEDKPETVDEKQPAPRKKPEKIDETLTIDPFKRK
jgi:serine/threonine-protein kinase